MHRATSTPDRGADVELSTAFTRHGRGRVEYHRGRLTFRAHARAGSPALADLDFHRATGTAPHAALVDTMAGAVVDAAVEATGGEVVEDIEPASSAAPRLAAVPVRSGGLDRMALLLDFGSGRDVVGLAVLALFDVTGEPQLLDAANVATGKSTSFFDPAWMRVGTGDDLLATVSSHHNSSQGYTHTNLILVRNDNLDLIDAIFTFDEKLCGYERTQRLDVRQGPGEPVSDIVAVVTEQVSATEEKCSDPAPEPGTRTINVTYHWDAGQQRYVPDSDAFDVLSRDNEGRF